MTDPAPRPEGWERMRGVLGRIAVGPQGSRDLSEEEAREALRLCLDREASDVQIGVFLIAERLKRETDGENRGFLRALQEASRVTTAPCDEVVSLADPYDGLRRVAHYGPVVAAVLGACGLPTCVHGARDVAPKHGITHRQVFEARGAPIDVGGGAAGVDRAARRLVELGAAYVDLEDFCPALAALGPIREEIAKRPFLATLDKLITPLRGARRTHVVAGYVHAGYDRLLLHLMAASGFASGLVVRGREGFVDPHVHRETEMRGFRSDAGEAGVAEVGADPKGLGLLMQAPERDACPDAAAVAGLWDLALHRKRRSHGGHQVRLLAGTILHHVGRASTVMRGVGLAHQAIVSQRAAEVLQGMAG